MQSYRQFFDFLKTFTMARILALGFLTVGINFLAHAQNEPRTDSRAEGFTFKIDAGFSLLQELKRPGSSQADVMHPTLAATQPRTLGISLFRITADLHSENGSGVFFVLRPDSQIYSSNPNREADFRSGNPYRLSPSLKLLDQYYVYIDPLPQMKLLFGVFDRLDYNERAYDDVIDFAGQVKFPRKFSAIYLNWNECSNTPTVSLPKPSCSLSYDIFGFQGDDDRGDFYAKSDKSFDTAATALNPYQGAAARLKWQSDFFSSALMMGFANRTETESKVSRQFLQAPINFNFSVGNFLQNTTLDLRFEKENFTSEKYNLDDTTQKSAELAHVFLINKEMGILASGRYGESDRNVLVANLAPVRTQLKYRQIEFGLQHFIHKDLKITALGTSELQLVSDDKGSSGGLIASDGKDSGNQSRFLLDLRYSR